MKLDTMDDKLLRKYLLGDVSAGEQEEIELWLMSNEDAYDVLDVAEDELIDDSLAGKLSKGDLQKFNDHFMAAPERKAKYGFSRSFRRYVAEVTPKPAPQAASSWQAVMDFLSLRPALGFGVAALVLLSGIGLWSIFKLSDLNRRFDAATAQLADVTRERDEIRRQLDANQSLSAALKGQLDKLEQAVGDLKGSAAPQNLLAVNLLPGLSRSAGVVATVSMHLNTQAVQFSLTLLDDNYESYQVTLRDAQGQTLWTRDGLKPTSSKEAKAVVLTLPAALLQTADYSLGLSGLSKNQPLENISTYSFHAVR